MTVPNGTFFIRVNTKLVSYRRNENARRRRDAERKGQRTGGRRERERRERTRGMERVSRQGNASAVNEQTLIFSRTKTHRPYHHLSSADHEPAPMFRNSREERAGG